MLQLGADFTAKRDTICSFTDQRAQEVAMRLRFLAFVVGAVVALSQTRVNPLQAQAGPQAALAGRVSSAEDGPLEGVLVSAKRAGSTVTVTLVSDQQGRYRFPQSRLEPGQDTLRF